MDTPTATVRQASLAAAQQQNAAQAAALAKAEGQARALEEEAARRKAQLDALAAEVEEAQQAPPGTRFGVCVRTNIRVSDRSPSCFTVGIRMKQ